MTVEDLNVLHGGIRFRGDAPRANAPFEFAAALERRRPRELAEQGDSIRGFAIGRAREREAADAMHSPLARGIGRDGLTRHAKSARERTKEPEATSVRCFDSHES